MTAGSVCDLYGQQGVLGVGDRYDGGQGGEGGRPLHRDEGREMARVVGEEEGAVVNLTGADLQGQVDASWRGRRS